MELQFPAYNTKAIALQNMRKLSDTNAINLGVYIYSL